LFSKEKQYGAFSNELSFRPVFASQRPEQKPLNFEKTSEKINP